MCILCEMKAKAAAEAGLELVVTPVGKISKEYIEKLSQLDAQHDNLVEEANEEENRLIEESTARIQEQLRVKYEHQFNNVEAQQKAIFEEAMLAEGIKPKEINKEFSINRETGEVSIRELVPMATTGSVH